MACSSSSMRKCLRPDSSVSSNDVTIGHIKHPWGKWHKLPRTPQLRVSLAQRSEVSLETLQQEREWWEICIWLWPSRWHGVSLPEIVCTHKCVLACVSVLPAASLGKHSSWASTEGTIHTALVASSAGCSCRSRCCAPSTSSGDVRGTGVLCESARNLLNILSHTSGV